MTDDAPPPRRAPRLFEAADAGPPPAGPPPDDSFAPQPASPAAAPPKAAQPGRAGSAWFWAAASALLGLILSVAAWDFAAAMLARNPVLGSVATVLLVALGAGLALFALSETAALARLSRVDGLRSDAQAALNADDRRAAMAAARKLAALYASRPDMAWALGDLKARLPDAVDARAVIETAERAVLTPLDARAQAEVTRAARQVAAATAMIPHAVVDVVAALALNLRMARRIAGIYGGRAGWLGSFRLVRAILGHVLATGVVSLGDDLAGPALGGGAAGVVSRRLGEGVLNGALTARVGVAAIMVCRPAPFVADKPPRWRNLALATLRGLR